VSNSIFIVFYSELTSYIWHLFGFWLVFAAALLLNTPILSGGKTMAEIKGTLERRTTSRWWYGSYRIDGRRKAVNLHIEVRGTPPGKGEEHGSVHFEKSRSEADAALLAHLADVNGSRTTEELAQAVHEARTGRKVDAYLVSDLPRLWQEKPRSKPPTVKHAAQCQTILAGFVEWCTDHYPRSTKLDHISGDISRAFMDGQSERGISPRTWNFILSTIKTACRRGACTAFDDIPQKPLETVHRVPFSPEELQAVLNAAKADDLIYPLVVTAACTAMRKGDCCRLRWKDIDLHSGFITVKTSKTGRTVDIPIADLLRNEIGKQSGNGSKYVFPELAKQYEADDSFLSKRFKRVLAAAGFHDGKVPPAELAPFNPKELAKKAEAYFRAIPTDQKREKARAMFETYATGTPLCQSAEAVGISKATGSAYLNEIEQETGIAFIRGKRREKPKLAPSRGKVSLERETGVRRASVRDFHALRTTWITLALMQGMPLELVQTVTGHATAEIIMQHYFKPQREQLKAAMQKSLPGLLTSKADPFTPAERAAEVLRGINAMNWRKVADEALKILEGTK
jgi:integrase